MGVSHEELKEILTCPVCVKILKEPLILTCLHTVCAGCLVVLQEQGKIKCPLCRQISEEPEIKKDFSKQNLIDVFKKTVSSSKKPRRLKKVKTSNKPRLNRCQVCAKDSIAWGCIDCTKLFCERCKVLHPSIPACSEHDLKPVELILKPFNEKLKETTATLQMCAGKLVKKHQKLINTKQAFLKKKMDLLTDLKKAEQDAKRVIENAFVNARQALELRSLKYVIKVDGILTNLVRMERMFNEHQTDIQDAINGNNYLKLICNTEAACNIIEQDIETALDLVVEQELMPEFVLKPQQLSVRTINVLEDEAKMPTEKMPQFVLKPRELSVKSVPLTEDPNFQPDVMMPRQTVFSIKKNEGSDGKPSYIDQMTAHANVEATNQDFKNMEVNTLNIQNLLENPERKSRSSDQMVAKMNVDEAELYVKVQMSNIQTIQKFPEWKLPLFEQLRTGVNIEAPVQDLENPDLMIQTNAAKMKSCEQLEVDVHTPTQENDTEYPEMMLPIIETMHKYSEQNSTLFLQSDADVNTHATGTDFQNIEVFPNMQNMRKVSEEAAPAADQIASEIKIETTPEFDTLEVIMPKIHTLQYSEKNLVDKQLSTVGNAKLTESHSCPDLTYIDVNMPSSNQMAVEVNTAAKDQDFETERPMSYDQGLKTISKRKSLSCQHLNTGRNTEAKCTDLGRVGLPMANVQPIPTSTDGKSIEELVEEVNIIEETDMKAVPSIETLPKESEVKSPTSDQLAVDVTIDATSPDLENPAMIVPTTRAVPQEAQGKLPSCDQMAVDVTKNARDSESQNTEIVMLNTLAVRTELTSPTPDQVSVDLTSKNATQCDVGKADTSINMEVLMSNVQKISRGKSISSDHINGEVDSRIPDPDLENRKVMTHITSSPHQIADGLKLEVKSPPVQPNTGIPDTDFEHLEAEQRPDIEERYPSLKPVDPEMTVVPRKACSSFQTQSYHFETASLKNLHQRNWQLENVVNLKCLQDHYLKLSCVGDEIWCILSDGIEVYNQDGIYLRHFQNDAVGNPAHVLETVRGDILVAGSEGFFLFDQHNQVQRKLTSDKYISTCSLLSQTEESVCGLDICSKQAVVFRNICHGKWEKSATVALPEVDNVRDTINGNKSHIFVCMYSRGEICQYDIRTGNIQHRLDFNGNIGTALKLPYVCHLDWKGWLLVCESGKKRLIFLDAEGNLHQMHLDVDIDPGYAVLDHTGNLWVSNTGQKLLKFEISIELDNAQEEDCLSFAEREELLSLV